MSKKETIEKYEECVRAFYKKNKRVPKHEECGKYANTVLVNKYGSWDNAIRMLLGVQSLKTIWTKEMLDEEFRRVCAEKQRLPEMKDFTTAATNFIDRYYKKIYLANEAIFGDSVRLIILRALEKLTPPGCDNATTGEIVSELARRGMNMNSFCAAWHLNASKLERFVENGRYDRTTWWKLTPAGKEFLKKFHPVKSKNTRGDHYGN